MRSLQFVSLRLVMEHVLSSDGSCNRASPEDRLMVRGELEFTRLQLSKLAYESSGREDELSMRTWPMPSRHSMRGHTFHLYVSKHNHGAAEVATLLVDEAKRATAGDHMRQALAVTSDPAQREQAAQFLLYLNEHTHANAERLHEELADALADGTRILLVHERMR